MANNYLFIIPQCQRGKNACLSAFVHLFVPLTKYPMNRGTDLMELSKSNHWIDTQLNYFWRQLNSKLPLQQSNLKAKSCCGYYFNLTAIQPLWKLPCAGTQRNFKIREGKGFQISKAYSWDLGLMFQFHWNSHLHEYDRSISSVRQVSKWY